MADAHPRPSLLDRLVDEDPTAAQEAPPGPQESYQRLFDGLRRDLLELLNTRELCRSWPAELRELGSSVLAYGVPDVTGAHLGSRADRDRFFDSLGPVIRRCDPRFKTVRIVRGDRSETDDRILRFRIEAVVRVEGGPEPVTFDLQFEPVTRTFES